jgi:hypothetical protein
MKLSFLYYSVFFLILAIAGFSFKTEPRKSSCHETPGSVLQPQDEEGWKILFDGKTTNGWRNFKGNGVNEDWYVENGSLIVQGKGGNMGGDIITEEQFADFELIVEWAISKGGNSGIFYHVLENDYPAVYATGPEYQLIDDAGFPEKLEEWQKTGANYAMHDPENKSLKAVGEFNESRIIVKNCHVEHWLNGSLVVAYDLWTEDWYDRVQKSKWKDYPGYGLACKGHIALQDHGSIAKFRNVRIRDLTDTGIQLFNESDLTGWKIHGTEKWYVENGELVCESGADKQYGYLATERIYKNFILRLQFKQESEGNSGVFFHSAIEGTKITGWQAEVAPPGKDTGGIYESYGRGWLYQIPEDKEDILKMGEWNDMVIKVEGDRVMTWLNNEMMTDITDGKIGQATGVIAVQIHDGGGIKVKWRNIFIKEL